MGGIFKLIPLWSISTALTLLISIYVYDFEFNSRKVLSKDSGYNANHFSRFHKIKPYRSPSATLISRKKRIQVKTSTFDEFHIRNKFNVFSFIYNLNQFFK